MWHSDSLSLFLKSVPNLMNTWQLDLNEESNGHRSKSNRVRDSSRLNCLNRTHAIVFGKPARVEQPHRLSFNFPALPPATPSPRWKVDFFFEDAILRLLLIVPNCVLLPCREMRRLCAELNPALKAIKRRPTCAARTVFRASDIQWDSNYETPLSTRIGRVNEHWRPLPLSLSLRLSILARKPRVQWQPL